MKYLILLAAFLAMWGLACVGEGATQRFMREHNETTRSFIEDFFREVGQNHDLAAARERYWHADITFPGSPDDRPGVDGAVRQAEALLRSFPNLRLDLDDLVLQADRLAVRFTVSGTHTGAPFSGIAATNQSFRAQGQAFIELKDGKMWKVWALIGER
jgi:predicted ester cyclase